jgi:hypothetical protein
MKGKFSFILLVLLVLLVVLSFFSCSRDKVKPHILLITIDTLRRDHLGVYGYPRDTSPFIDELARDGVMFRNVITPIPLTAPSHASILTSLHPLTHSVTLNGVKLDHRVQTIVEVLKENGYYTIGAIAMGCLTGNKNFSQGFDSFSDQWEREGHLSRTLVERTAPSVNKSLFKQIEEYDSKHRDKPLFIWAHYYDPHYPYYSHNHITLKTKIEEGKPKVINEYDKEIRYTDEHIKKLYNHLEKKGITRMLVTCITGDHGEQFGEHGYTGGHMDFYSENTHVPLILHGYGIPQNKIIDTYVSTMDIGITLLGMVGLTFDSPTEGIDLKKLIKKPKTYLNRKFLIIGTPKWSRSLQLVGYPFAYILNFDYHYKYWYVSYQPTPRINETRFQPLHKKHMKIKGSQIFIRLPHVLERGRNYVVLRADILQNEGFSFNIKVKPLLNTKKIKAPGTPGKIKHLEVVYPVTVLDQIQVSLYLNINTRIDNFRYAIITKDEFPKKAKFTKKIENRIYQRLMTQRKGKQENEFFDLSTDIEMEKNQVTVKKFKPTIMNYKKLIYSVFKYYCKKNTRLLKGSYEQSELTAEDKRILKTLGYL